MTHGELIPLRADVQGEYNDRNGEFIRPTSDHIQPGTISWDEHATAWIVYSSNYGTDQSALTIHQRGGFGYWELHTYLGHKPRTWRSADITE